MKNKLIFLFDGGCPLCLRETNFLKKPYSFQKNTSAYQIPIISDKKYQTFCGT